MSTHVNLASIPHGFKPMDVDRRSICRECDGPPDDSRHFATPAILNYPLQYSSISLGGPTLFYIDAHGTPIQLVISNEQAQMVIDDWNTSLNLNSEIGEAVATLGPPRE